MLRIISTHLIILFFLEVDMHMGLVHLEWDNCFLYIFFIISNQVF